MDEYENTGADYAVDTLSSLRKQIKELEADIATRPAKPLYGEARSCILVAMDNSANVDIAIEKWNKLKELEAEIEQHRWIPVSERLPERRTKVLTLGPAEPLEGKSGPAVAWMGEDGETWWTYGNSTGYYIPTHWKPIVLLEQSLKG